MDRFEEAVVHPVLVIVATCTIPQLDIGAVIGIPTGKVNTFIVVQRGMDRAIRGMEIPFLRVGAVAAPRLDIVTIAGSAAIVVNTLVRVIGEVDAIIRLCAAEPIQDETICCFHGRIVLDHHDVRDRHLLGIQVTAATSAGMIAGTIAATGITTTATAGNISVAAWTKSKWYIDRIKIKIIIIVTIIVISLSRQ